VSNAGRASEEAIPFDPVLSGSLAFLWLTARRIGAARAPGSSDGEAGIWPMRGRDAVVSRSLPA
jgi:hypothetical protein